MRIPILLSLIPLVAAGCGGGTTPASAPPPSTAAAAAAPGAIWAEAPGAGAKAVTDVGTGSQGQTTTRLLVADAKTGAARAVRYVDGRWELPVPVPGGDREGPSWNGELVVLRSADRPSRFAVVRLDGQAEPQVIDLAADGEFEYDALSPDGRFLYLTQYRDAAGTQVDRIRQYDLGAGKLAAEPVVDKSEGGEAMAGTPVARALSGDGATVYTVYEGEEHPFLHTLLTGDAISFCTDLPATGLPDEPGRWTVRVSADGGQVTASSGRLGKAFVIQIADGVPAISSIADLPPGTLAT